MEGGNGQKSEMAREKNMEKQKAVKGSQLESNKKAMTIQGQMDLETENRIAAILMKEAAEMRQQAEREGVRVYLRQPKVRGRPNSRFLTSTVLGIQQANRAAEVSEMWRVRQRELELDDKLKRRSRDESSSSSSHGDHRISRNISVRSGVDDKDIAVMSTSSKRGIKDRHWSEDDDDDLMDEDIEEFLHSRVKRGRGTVGSRMDETGPYLQPLNSDSKGKLLASTDMRVNEEWEHRVLAPEKPPFLKSCEPSEDEVINQESWKKLKEAGTESSQKGHSKKRRSTDNKSQHKKKKKEKKLKKHRGNI